MNIMALGLDLNGQPLFSSRDEESFLNALQALLGRNVQSMRSFTHATSEGVSFRSEIKRQALDIGDPRSSGWTYLIGRNDPDRRMIEDILRPLCKLRGMGDFNSPMVFDETENREVLDWVYDNYFGLTLEGKKVPNYILMVGGPEILPFQLQSLLDSVASVGRVCFDSLSELETYVQKVVRLEGDSKPPVEKRVVIFGPDAGLPDPTYFSSLYMAKPIATHVRERFGFSVSSLFGEEATKQNLETALRVGKPALVYTASHGLGAIKESAEVQRRLNGAICCQHVAQLTKPDLFSADDIPKDEPFLEGSIFFQFACFGYGTPAVSDYSHWINGFPERYSDSDFIASLPKKLLSHPRGPIAFIGHLDTAFLHAFTDAQSPQIVERWHSRMAPFVDALNQILGVQPCGLALEMMNKRFGLCSNLILNTYDREKRGRLKWTKEVKQRFLDYWIQRGDSQNYMLFGDPGARIRI